LQILGSEIPHTWCYYFEKAELARQFGEFQEVLSLFDQATNKGYSPIVDTEWYPFIDAYARNGDLKNAELITRGLANKDDEALHLGLCHLWKNLARDFTDPISTTITSEMVDSILNCGH
jgi:hypothetical protein